MSDTRLVDYSDSDSDDCFSSRKRKDWIKKVDYADDTMELSRYKGVMEVAGDSLEVKEMIEDSEDDEPPVIIDEINPLLSEVFEIKPPVNMRSWKIKGLVERAITSGNLEAVLALRDKGVDLRTTDKDGWTFLHRTAAFGVNDITSHLILIEGIDVDVKWLFWQRTPLHVAAENGKLETVQLLVRLGADIDSTDFRGRTPLHEAVRGGWLDISVFLVLAGSGLTKEDSDGLSPLHLAKKFSRVEIAKFLEVAENHAKSCLSCSTNPMFTMADDGLISRDPRLRKMPSDFIICS